VKMYTLIIRREEEFGYLYDESKTLHSTHKFTEYRQSGSEVKFYLQDTYAGRVNVDVVEVV